MTVTNVAFIFPGQGSQSVGMLADIAKDFSIVEETFAQASEVLDYDVWSLVQSGPQEALNLTQRTQPMLLTASVALWRVYRQQGGRLPALMAGHSLGEWSALVCANVVAFSDAVKLVALRGQYMQEAVPAGEGAMAAIIGLDDDVIIDICQQAADDDTVAPVNFNSPAQVVIAGHSSAVERAIVLCKEQGAKRALSLPVSAPFHTRLMEPAATRLQAQIEAVAFTSPSIPVVHNVHASTEENPEAIKKLMIQQIYSPVMWVDCVKRIAASDVDTLIECGPGKVLSGLVRRIDKSLSVNAIETPDGMAKAVVDNTVSA